MARITKSGEQYRINIPKDVILLTGWDENTEVGIFPYLKDLTDPIDENTPVLMRKISVRRENG
ncbi:hypothetical protein [Methanoregula sp.]|uniref:hypothetical protein n=1 Tax=Methanoregula sp. TaxID=2052170 RepID=UPI003BB0ADFF